MKDYFKVESKRLSDTADIILHTPNKALSLSTELANTAAELPISLKTPSDPNAPKKGRTSLLSLSPILGRTGKDYWELEEEEDGSFDVDEEEEEGEQEEGAGEEERKRKDENEKGKERGKEKKQVTFVDSVGGDENDTESLKKVKQRVRTLTEELEKFKKAGGGGGGANPTTQLSQGSHLATGNGTKAIGILSSTSPEGGDLPKSQEQLLLSEVDIVDILIIFFSSLH